MLLFNFWIEKIVRWTNLVMEHIVDNQLLIKQTIDKVNEIELQITWKKISLMILCLACELDAIE